MNKKALLPLALSVVLFFFMLFVSLPLMLLCVLVFIAVISLLVACSFLFLPTQMPVRVKQPYVITTLQPTMVRRDGLPFVPRTLREVLAMSPEEFEIFSAAVVIAMGQGHTFYRHCGRSGDQGVDALLWNMHGFRVAIQSKRYASDTTVSSEEVRTFAGSLLYYQAIYGFFVTTSRFTNDARDVIRASTSIRVIDGQHLEVYLQRRSREIALAWAEVLDQMSGGAMTT
jgi:Restriction endonuclease